jgi:hypothetical protein
MLNKIVPILMLFVTLPAKAAIVDQFDCRITILNAAGTTVTEIQQATAAKRSPTSEPLTTQGVAAVNVTVPGMFHVGLILEYYHKTGGPGRAWQSTCVLGNFVDKNNPDATLRNSCSPQGIPGELAPWAEVPLMDGIPLFESAPELRLKNGAYEARFRCYSQGTFP